MRETIEVLSDRAEFVLVVGSSFTYFVGTSLVVLLRGQRTFELSTASVLRGIGMELAILAIVASILRVRGWRLSHVTKRISLPACLAGIPLFAAYIAIYWSASLLAVRWHPAAAHLVTLQLLPTAPVPLLGAFILINAVFEETIVVGYVVSALSRQGFALSVAASTLLRFLCHLYQGPLGSISILALGVLFAAVYWRWRNLSPLIVAHTAAGAAAFMLFAQRIQSG